MGIQIINPEFIRLTSPWRNNESSFISTRHIVSMRPAKVGGVAYTTVQLTVGTVDTSLTEQEILAIMYPSWEH